ncbi:MAG: hypothetical protein JSS49_23730 [Planctomycetes bacterium]|nr:hypothetical protein [Planctomycetota bacterium]
MPVDFRRAAQNHPATAPRVLAPVATNVFTLHSRPGATKVIYLDFDGQTTTNTPWSRGTIVTTAYDMDNNPSSFSTAEQTNIQEIWQRVAECYSPFDVDVTTEAPATADLINTGGTDTKWGIRVLFGTPNPSPAPGSGGVAYVGSFGWNYGTGVDVPCFVLQDGVGTVPKYNADAAVHEIGHTVGLSHDGQFPANSPNHVEYYEGQGSGAVAWAPHLGAGYYVPLVQWSKGEYANPSNTQDDLAIITTQNGFGYRTDDYASTQATAVAIPGAAGSSTFAVQVSGVIERNTDSDWFKIASGAGAIKLNAVGGPANTMLDIQLSLYNSSGSLIVAANPTTDVVAAINQTVAAGTYFVKIEGVANGDPLTTGYTKYSSLGQYTITGSYVPATTVVTTSAPVLGGASNLAYTAKAAATAICPGITVTDSDSPRLPSATVTITNVVSTEDVLSLTAKSATMGNITGTYNKTTGVMTLTSAGATATLAQFKAALAAVSYSNTSAAPSTTPRQVHFQATDGANASNVLQSTITIGSGFNIVTVDYNASTKTLTLNDDGGNNAVSITLRGTTITVQGAGTTRIGAGNATAVTLPYSGAVTLICNFTGGNDSLSISSLKCTNATINLGDGNDAATLTYCTVLSNLTVNGGAGTDTLKLVGTYTKSKTVTSVP